MNALCTPFSDPQPPRQNMNFARIFSQAASAVDCAGQEIRKAALPPDMLDNLDLLVMITQHAFKNRLAVPPTSFASLQNIIREIQSALDVPMFREGLPEEELSRLTKAYQELTKVACAIAVQNDTELRSLLTDEAGHGARN